MSHEVKGLRFLEEMGLPDAYLAYDYNDSSYVYLMEFAGVLCRIQIDEEFNEADEIVLFVRDRKDLGSDVRVLVYEDVLKDIRATLNGICTDLFLANMEIVDAKRRIHLERAERCGHTAMSMIDKLKSATLELILGVEHGRKLFYAAGSVRSRTYAALDGSQSPEEVRMFIMELLTLVELPEFPSAPSKPKMRLIETGSVFQDMADEFVNQGSPSLLPAFDNGLVTGDVKNGGEWHRCIMIARELLAQKLWDGKMRLHICGNVDEIHRQIARNRGFPFVNIIGDCCYCYRDGADIPVDIPQEKPYIVYNISLYGDAVGELGIDNVKDECIAGRFETMELACAFALSQCESTGDAFGIIEPGMKAAVKPDEAPLHFAHYTDEIEFLHSLINRLPKGSYLAKLLTDELLGAFAYDVSAGQDPNFYSDFVALRKRAQMMSEETHDWQAKYDAMGKSFEEARTRFASDRDEWRSIKDKLKANHRETIKKMFDAIAEKDELQHELESVKRQYNEQLREFVLDKLRFQNQRHKMAKLLANRSRTGRKLVRLLR